MGKGTTYKKPRRINIVSFLVVLLLAGAIYGAVQFGPVYYRKWQAKSVVGQCANKVFSKRRVPGEGETAVLEQARAVAMKRLRQLGIKDPDLSLTIDKTDKWVLVKGDYYEVIKHPLINKQTRLHFRPWVRVVEQESAGIEEY